MNTDPVLGTKARWRPAGSTEALRMWSMPVHGTDLQVRHFGAQTDPAEPLHRLDGMDIAGEAMEVVSPGDGVVQRVEPVLVIRQKIVVGAVRHQLENLGSVVVKAGQVVRRGQAVGRSRSGLRWRVDIAFENEDHWEIMGRWNRLLQKAPGNPGLVRNAAAWLSDPDNPEWVHLLATLERGGELPAGEQAQVWIGEKGEQVATVVRDTIRDAAALAVNTVRDGTEDVLGEDWGWYVGGVLVLGAAGFVAYKVLR